MSMKIGSYQINLDALLARIVYRWRGRSLLAVLLLVGSTGLSSGHLPPFWRGRASLTIHAAPGAAVAVDGRPWPDHAAEAPPIYAGRHSVVATMPDGRAAWADVELRAGEALTLTLPPGLPEPRERPLPPAAPGMQIAHVWWADGAWRVASLPEAPPTPESGQAGAPTPTPGFGQTVAVGAHGMERLPTLDAYAGLADQTHRGNQRVEAVYRSGEGDGYGKRGSVEVRGWGHAPQTLPISAPLTLLRFAPGGTALLMAEQVETGGEQVYLAQPNGDRAPLVAVPGRVVRLSWRDDGGALVLHSLAGERLTLTLIRLRAATMPAAPPVAAVVADLDAGHYAGALVPLTWDSSGLLWIAPDEAGTFMLWNAPTATLIPERRGALDARAITQLSDGALRVVVALGDQLAIGRYQGQVFVGEALLAHVAPAADLTGTWQGNQLLLASGGQAWLLDVPERANEEGR